MIGNLEITEDLRGYMKKERIVVVSHEDGVVYIDTASQEETAQVMSYLRGGNRQWRIINTDSNKEGNRWKTIAYFERILVGGNKN